MSLYNRGLGQHGNGLVVGSDKPSIGMQVGMAAAIFGGLYLLIRRGKDRELPGMADVNAKLRARGRDPSKYGW